MMMTSDPIADMLTRIRNANTAKHDKMCIRDSLWLTVPNSIVIRVPTVHVLHPVSYTHLDVYKRQ